MIKVLRFRQPDDWHLHLRDGTMLQTVLPYSANIFARAIIMPNLKPPITTTAQALAYKKRILAALPEGSHFEPLMTLYFTDTTTPKIIDEAYAAGIKALKLYPAYATTNSAHGVTNIENIYPALERMQELGMLVLIHGEVTDPDVDIFDREQAFLVNALCQLLDRFPKQKFVLEHLTTSEAVCLVEQNSNLAGTITAHHLVINRDNIFAGGLRPHLYCLPIAKRKHHQLALRRAATSGHPRFFLGTDSAPHPMHEKESSCGCAGIFSAPSAMEIYARVFEEENALEKLEAFASLNGPAFYGLPPNEGHIVLRKEEWRVPKCITVESVPRDLHDHFQPVTGTHRFLIIPFLAGETIPWKVSHIET